MKTLRPFVLLLLPLFAATGCNKAAEARADSLAVAHTELLEEVLSATQFVNQINAELARSAALKATPRLLESTAEMATVNEERREVLGRITALVAMLDTAQTRLAQSRSRALQLSRRDSSLVARVARLEAYVSELQVAAEDRGKELQGIIDAQEVRIAELTAQVDTLNTVRVVLTDSLTRVIAERDAAYYVVGTKQELIEAGVLVEQGPRRFLIAGSRPLMPARELDPARFIKIDRKSNREIELGEGQFEIISRQNAGFATPRDQRGNKIAGGLTIEQPEQFWAGSPFLIIVKS